MNLEYTVGEIVRTYDLLPALQLKVTGIATRRISELHINGFDNIYRYIDYLVGRFDPQDQHSPTFSLDARLWHDSSVTSHDRIGVEDPNLRNFFEQSLSVGQAVNILIEKVGVDPAVFQFLLPTEEYRSHRLNYSQEDVLANAPTIKKRLEYLAREFQDDERRGALRRSIVQVRLNPFYVKFGRRLVPQLTQEQINGIIATRQYYSNSNEASKHLPYTASTILKYWRIYGLALLRSDAPEILSAYQRYEGSARAASKGLGVPCSVINELWYSAKLKPFGFNIGKRKKKLEKSGTSQLTNSNRIVVRKFSRKIISDPSPSPSRSS